MKKFYEKFCKFEENLALVLLAGLTILVFVSAMMRTTGFPLNWAQDAALVAFAWMIFFGSDIALRGPGLIGVDPVVFGMIMMTTVTFGVMTPPVGTALYTCSDIMGCSIQETVKYGWPFYLAIVGVILFMVFFPDAVLFLPNLVYGAGG